MQALGSPEKQWKSPLSQQGDVIIKKCGRFDVFEVEHETIPESAKPVPGNLVFKGQTNSHALYGGKFEILEHDGVTFLRVTEPTILDHVRDHASASPERAEHHAQWIPVGDYFVDGVREFDHIKEESRRVID